MSRSKQPDNKKIGSSMRGSQRSRLALSCKIAESASPVAFANSTVSLLASGNRTPSIHCICYRLQLAQEVVPYLVNNKGHIEGWHVFWEGPRIRQADAKSE
jgi:hypothetical protein